MSGMLAASFLAPVSNCMHGLARMKGDAHKISKVIAQRSAALLSGAKSLKQAVYRKDIPHKDQPLDSSLHAVVFNPLTHNFQSLVLHSIVLLHDARSGKNQRPAANALRLLGS
eukprot:1161781-Pelagomonas_calceolata.AAC.18